MMMFGGYLIAGSLTLFIMFRIIHGVSFGMVTVGGNTVVIDIMPSSRRGEGLGYYGLTNNTAMSIGRSLICNNILLRIRSMYIRIFISQSGKDTL